MTFRPCSAVLPTERAACLSALAIGVLALGAPACSSFESAVNPSLVSCQVSASMPGQTIAAVGGRGALDVSALPECAWQISPTSSWISGITPASGQGDQLVTFVAAGNPTQQPRQGEIVINSLRLTVRQEGAPAPPPAPPAPTLPAPTPAPPSPGPAPSPCSYAIKPDQIKIGRNGATGRTVSVTTVAGCQWTAVSNATWITVTSGASGTGSGVVTFNIAANTGGKRTGTLTIAGHTLRVDQEKD